ncbi:MAG: ribonuclease P protein component [Anaerolineae bacterium]|nr:ribonuclease P protein component [Anaerolineae bacterium]
MKRIYRLTRSVDFKRVRAVGSSYAHPQMVVLVAQNDQTHSRYGVVAGQGVGHAVQRNRAKRRIRAAIHALYPQIEIGWDVIVVARSGIREVCFWEIRDVLESLLRRAGLLKDATDNRSE